MLIPDPGKLFTLMCMMYYTHWTNYQMSRWTLVCYVGDHVLARFSFEMKNSFSCVSQENIHLRINIDNIAELKWKNKCASRKNRKSCIRIEILIKLAILEAI